MPLLVNVFIIQQLLLPSLAKTLSSLNYFNFLLIGLPTSTLTISQTIPNVTMVLLKHQSDEVLFPLRTLQLLPISLRVSPSNGLKGLHMIKLSSLQLHFLTGSLCTPLLQPQFAVLKTCKVKFAFGFFVCLFFKTFKFFSFSKFQLYYTLLPIIVSHYTLDSQTLFILELKVCALYQPLPLSLTSRPIVTTFLLFVSEFDIYFFRLHI